MRGLAASIVAGVAVLAAVAVTRADQSPAPLPARPAALDRLDRLVGSWQSNGTFVDSVYSKAGSATATTRCAWSDDRLFLLCQQHVVLDGKLTDDVAIYTYDDATQAYRFYNVGTARENSTQIDVSANGITYDGEFTDGAKRVLTRTRNVWESARAYSWRAEYSLDGGTTWVLMGSGRSLLAVDR